MLVRTCLTVVVIATVSLSLTRTLLSLLSSPSERGGWLPSAKSRSSRFQEEIVPCIGPQGQLITPSINVAGEEHIFDDAHQPFAGSYAELNLEHTWTTAASRYSLYGFTKKFGATSHKKWASVNWAHLQNECLKRNLHPSVNKDDIPLPPSTRRMTLPSHHEHSHSVPSILRKRKPTGRTAILLRGYSTFIVHPEDLWTLRSLITETSLSYGGRYTVILLVDVKGGEDVFHNSTAYEEVLDQAIPPEFRDMALLIDQQHLLKQWYPKVGEHRPEYQIEQARQLFAFQFPEFDHIWQFELDVRFTGHAGKMIQALESFATEEPRKQSVERASYWFLPAAHGSYANLVDAVNRALEGGTNFWHGAAIPDIPFPLGPSPPVAEAEDDDFTWGVGEEADLILLSRTMNITLDRHWNFRNYIAHFELGTATPRLTSAPAMSRTSHQLLMAMHHAQVDQGLRMPSEATPVSFALYHNLKISHPPMPVYARFEKNCTTEEVDEYFNGGPPSAEHEGMAWGENPYGMIFPERKQRVGVKVLGRSWQWKVGWPGELWHAWTKNDVGRLKRDWGDQEVLMARKGNNGKEEVYMPNLIMHAVKSNPIRPANEVG